MQEFDFLHCVYFYGSTIHIVRDYTLLLKTKKITSLSILLTFYSLQHNKHQK